MNIIFSVFRYHTNMVSIVKALEDNGYNVILVVVTKEENEDHTYGTIEVLDTLLPLSSQITKLFERYSPELVVVREALNEKSSRAFALEARKNKIRAVSYEQNNCYARSKFRAVYIGIRHALIQLKKGMPLVEVSPKPGKLGGYKVPFRKFFWFPMCLRDRQGERTYCPKGKVRITAVGKLGIPRKRLEWVVEATRSLSDRVEVKIIGSNDIAKYPNNRSRVYYDELYRMTENMREAGVMKIIENLPFTEMQDVYKNTDIFVLPSKGEKFGVSPLEAMEAGCAVICADDNGSSPYIKDAYDGMVFESGSYNSFLSRIYALIDNPSEISKLGENAMKTVKTRHSCEMFAVDFIEKLN